MPRTRLGLGLGLTQAGAGGGASFSPDSSFYAGSAGASFDMSDASKLFVDSARTIQVTTAGDLIGSATDLSGNGKHATQATGAKKPNWQTTYAAFDGVDDDMATATIDLTGTNKLTVVIGYKATDASGFDGLFERSVGVAGSFYAYGSAANIEYKTQGATAVAGGLYAASVGTDSVLTFSGDLSAASAALALTLRRNGVVIAATSFPNNNAPGGGNYSNAVTQIGQGAGVRLTGRIYRMIIIGRTLTAGELLSAETWCGAPAGIVI